MAVHALRERPMINDNTSGLGVMGFVVVGGCARMGERLLMARNIEHSVRSRHSRTITASDAMEQGIIDQFTWHSGAACRSDECVCVSGIKWRSLSNPHHIITRTLAPNTANKRHSHLVPWRHTAVAKFLHSHGINMCVT